MRKLCLGLSFVAMTALVACGDSSGTDSDLPVKSSNSSSESVDEYDGEVEYVEDLPKCTAKKDEKVYYVEDEDITYTCIYDEDVKKGEWVRKKKKARDDDQESSNSSGESDDEYDGTVEEFGDLRTCNEKRDGKVYYVEDEDVAYTCRYDEDLERGEWVSKKKKPADDDDDQESSSSVDETDDSSSSEELDDESSSSGSENFESGSSEGEESSSSIESSAEVEVSSDAGNGNSNVYDCSVYNCVTTEYLNQDMLESGLYGEYLDTRDNQVYKTIVIGTQTWMAQNLNYGQTNSFCADNELSNCTKYGRLYKSTVADTSCFDGWHVPSSSDWSTLYDFIYEEKKLSGNQVGKYLKSASLWTTPGVDSYGFSAVPGGYLWYNGTYKNVGSTVSFWVKSGTGMANVPKYLTSSDEFSEDSPRSTSDSFYIRCLKD